MIREIVIYPDPILQRPTEKVTAFDEELRTLAADMFESMYKAHRHRAGRAADRRGEAHHGHRSEQQEDPEDKIVLVNPEIIHREGKQVGKRAA